MNFYKYMEADIFCNYFYSNPKLKISKLEEFSDVYETDTFLTSIDIKRKIEEAVFIKRIEKAGLLAEINCFLYRLKPKDYHEIFNANTKNKGAQRIRKILIKTKSAEFYKNERIFKKSVSDATTKIQDFFSDLSGKLIVLCLSECEGSQILYDAYGKHTGVMLEFGDDYIVNRFQVEYGESLRKNYFLSKIERLVELLFETKTDDVIQEAAEIFFKTYAFKNKDYDYEHEYRIIKNCESVEKDPQLSKLGDTYLIDIGIPKSITLGYRFDKNDGAAAKRIAIEDFCRKYNVKLYQALKNDFDDEIMQRKEIEINQYNSRGDIIK